MLFSAMKWSHKYFCTLPLTWLQVGCKSEFLLMSGVKVCFLLLNTGLLRKINEILSKSGWKKQAAVSIRSPRTGSSIIGKLNWPMVEPSVTGTVSTSAPRTIDKTNNWTFDLTQWFYSTTIHFTLMQER